MSRFIVIIFLVIVFTFFSESQEIIKDIKAGNIEKIKEVIKKDPSQLKMTDESGNNLLIYAAFYKQNEILKFLLENGLDVNSKDEQGFSLLHIACFNCSKDLTKLLVEKGADINAKQEEYGTPLDLAASFCGDSLVQYLKERGGVYTPAKLEKTQITKNIYQIKFAYGHLVNILVYAGKDGIMLVDDGFSKSALPDVKKILFENGESEIKWIINTHLHFDHTTGNILLNDTMKILDLKSIESRKIPGMTRIDKTISGKSKSFPYYYSMKFNDEEIKLIPAAGLHTDDDWLIYFTKSDLVDMGDLLLSECYPSLRKNTAGYIEFLEKCQDVFPENTIFFCGHGKAINRQEFKDYCDMLKTTKLLIEEKLKEGKSIKEIKEDESIKGYDKKWHKMIQVLRINYWIDAINQR